jgi:putative tryptophan/tyrosine transport system substrate-binding protein
VKRRTFITLVGGAAAWPLAARAQQPGGMRRIGILFGGFSDTDPEPRARIEAFRRHLQELGWIDGRNIKIDLRFGAGDANRMRAYAEELIGMMPDVLAANSGPAVAAFARQTKTIPIVFANFFDPVGCVLIGVTVPLIWFIIYVCACPFGDECQGPYPRRQSPARRLRVRL